MTKDEALDLALRALDTCEVAWPGTRFKSKYFAEDEVKAAIAAIKQARALDKMAENARELGLDYEPVGEAYLCDKCQTPFDGAWECPNCGHRSATKESVYTTIPAAQRQWVGLTAEDRAEIAGFAAISDWHDFEVIGAVEAKLKEKNT